MSELRVPIRQWAIQAKQETKSEPRRDPFIMLELERVFSAIGRELEDKYHPGREDRALRRRFYVSPYTRNDD